MRIIGMIIIIGMVIGAVVSIDYSKFLDLQSLLIVLGGAIGYALAKGKPKEFIINFGDGCVYMGWIGLMIGIIIIGNHHACLLYTSPSPRDRTRSRMPSSA